MWYRFQFTMMWIKILICNDLDSNYFGWIYLLSNSLKIYFKISKKKLLTLEIERNEKNFFDIFVHIAIKLIKLIQKPIYVPKSYSYKIYAKHIFKKKSLHICKIFFFRFEFALRMPLAASEIFKISGSLYILLKLKIGVPVYLIEIEDRGSLYI